MQLIHRKKTPLNYRGGKKPFFKDGKNLSHFGSGCMWCPCPLLASQDVACGCTQDRVTTFPSDCARKGQLAPSKATGNGPQSSHGDQQLVPYRGRIWLSAAEAGSRTGVQVGQLGLILSINQVFRGKIGLFPYFFFEQAMSMHFTCCRRAPSTACLGTAGMSEPG